MKLLKRRYVYSETYDEVMAYSNQYKLRKPYFKNNFPFFLEQYIQHLKEKK